jgi:hypothetical protein
VKINPNGKQLVVYRVTTLLFTGKQPTACMKRVGKKIEILTFFENFELYKKKNYYH